MGCPSNKVRYPRVRWLPYRAVRSDIGRASPTDTSRWCWVYPGRFEKDACELVLIRLTGNRVNTTWYARRQWCLMPKRRRLEGWCSVWIVVKVTALLVWWYLIGLGYAAAACGTAFLQGWIVDNRVEHYSPGAMLMLLFAWLGWIDPRM
jgi:hypothetical protein